MCPLSRTNTHTNSYVGLTVFSKQNSFTILFVVVEFMKSYCCWIHEILVLSNSWNLKIKTLTFHSFSCSFLSLPSLLFWRCIALWIRIKVVFVSCLCPIYIIFVSHMPDSYLYDVFMIFVPVKRFDSILSLYNMVLAHPCLLFSSTNTKLEEELKAFFHFTKCF